MSAPSIIWPESIKYNFSISNSAWQPPEADGALPEARCWLYYGWNLDTKHGIRRQIFDCPHLSNRPWSTPPAVANIRTHHRPHLNIIVLCVTFYYGWPIGHPWNKICHLSIQISNRRVPNWNKQLKLKWNRTDGNKIIGGGASSLKHIRDFLETLKEKLGTMYRDKSTIKP